MKVEIQCTPNQWDDIHVGEGKNIRIETESGQMYVITDAVYPHKRRGDLLIVAYASSSLSVYPCANNSIEISGEELHE